MTTELKFESDFKMYDHDAGDLIIPVYKVLPHFLITLQCITLAAVHEILKLMSSYDLYVLFFHECAKEQLLQNSYKSPNFYL